MVVARSLKLWNGLFDIASGTKFHPSLCSRTRGLSVSASMSGRDGDSDGDGYDTLLPVLIVGAGPVGLVLSILLTKLGVKCSIVEKNKTFSSHPQAHFINNRTVEVFRKMNGLAEEIQKSQPPVDSWRKFIYCSSLTGSVLGTVDHMQPQDFEKVVSPVSVAHFSQYKLTRLLVEHLKKLDFQIREADNLEGLDCEVPRAREILMGHECISIDTTSNRCVIATVSNIDGGKCKERKLRCSTLVGADGAGSSLRRLLGISLRGEKEIQKLVSVHFLSKELGKHLLRERPGMLYFIFNTEAIGVLVAHDLEQGEFVLQMPFYPPQQNVQDFEPKICEKIIFKLVGRELGDIDVIDVKPWVMHAEVAEKFLSCDNRVIIAGDAAHRFPPAGGFGMNTGIQDAHNLAWKLAAVLEGISPSSFLHTYEAERKPIAIFNTTLSVQNFKAAMAVPASLGLDPAVANSVHRVVSDGFGSILPSEVQKAILNGAFSLGRAQLSTFLLNENNPLGSSRLAKLKRIFDEGKSLQLQFPAEDLGFRYLDGALIPDVDSTSVPLSVPTGCRRDYIPSADPGSRLPHMNVRAWSDSGKEGKMSTLDLVRGDKIEFLLIIAPIENSYNLARAAFNVAEEFRVSARVSVVWPVEAGNAFGEGSKVALAPWKNYLDVQEVKNPSMSYSSSWWELCRMTDRGAILVRPDEHIAWRVKSEIIGDPMLEMQKAFSAVLGVKLKAV